MHHSKRQLISHGKELLFAKRATLEEELLSIREDATNETKSSMGDKYETSREMMRQEENKLGSQIKIINDQLVSLDRINPERVSSKGELGSIISTQGATYFLSTGLGRVEFDGRIAFFISPVAPLAKQLMDKKEGDEILFNGVEHRIVSID